LKSPVTVPVEQLAKEPYASVLCYPKPSEAEAQARLKELKEHDVTAVEFSGKASAYGVSASLLGKGFVGIVVVAIRRGERVALKIRRVDADREDLLHEAEMLSKANTVNVGPRLLGKSKNFLLMQLIDGDLLPAWLKMFSEKAVVQTVLGEVLEQCFRLDEIGLDHGELSKAPKHVIVDKELKPWIVDFETSSDARKPANVTAISHFLFTSAGEVARTVAAALGERNKDEIVKALQKYKEQRTRESFDGVLRACLS
jgi:putative serine/threonine protein kinase